MENSEFKIKTDSLNKLLKKAQMVPQDDEMEYTEIPKEEQKTVVYGPVQDKVHELTVSINYDVGKMIEVFRRAFPDSQVPMSRAGMVEKEMSNIRVKIADALVELQKLVK